MIQISREAKFQINQIKELLCGTILVHLYDPEIMNRRTSVVGDKKPFLNIDQNDPVLNAEGTVVKVAFDCHEKIRTLLTNKPVKINYYSGKTYWKDHKTGELLILTNIDGILSVLKEEDNDNQ